MQYSDRQVRKTLDRLIPRLEPHLVDVPPVACEIFMERLGRIFPDLFAVLLEVYGDQFDFFYHLEQILITAAKYYAERSADLKALDAEREANPLWFQSEKMVGGVCYVDLFAGDLAGIEKRIPYFKELGITYLHLMPLFLAPEDNSDGGYAISDFRQVNPALGTMEELRELAAEFRKQGISLVLDFVFNHTADEHEWAVHALAGDADYQEYYLIFPDRTEPDQYEPMLREIFPEQAPGSFTYRPEIDSWVWTTFNTFQWDLNYRNPAVFNAMLGEMLFLANIGVEILRLDAVAFIWKEKGTVCENMNEAHLLIQAFNSLARLVAPAMVFKSEAIVHPDDVAKYFGEGDKAGYECPISYNPTLMALLWEALATRNVQMLQYAMQNRLSHPENCAWVNYIRCHDDIGWSFADEDAVKLNINGFDHRQFLNKFYTGDFEGSFANGLSFNFNPETLDMRICGMLASLAGLEKALKRQEQIEIDHAILRILMMNSIIMSIGGIPLIYLGDEIALKNDYSFQGDPTKELDNRWVHRRYIDPDMLARRTDKETIEGRVFQNMVKMIQIRKENPVFATGDTRVLDTNNPHVFGFTRWHEGENLLCLFNFSEQEQLVDIVRFRVYGLPVHLTDLLTGREATVTGRYTLDPYGYVWLKG